MTEEYFNEHVSKCKKCGNKPLLIVEKSMFSKTNDEKYRVVCWNCKWEDGDYSNNSRTGLCKTPEAALKIWNDKYGMED